MARTLAFENPSPSPRKFDTLVDPPATANTLADDGPTQAVRLPEHSTFDADATMAAEDARFSYARVSPGRSRSTVLPTWDGGAVFREGQLRYERLQSLGEGGMGEVSLARDHDIERRVAIKRLRPEHANTSALLRFAQEAVSYTHLTLPTNREV